jgi:RNA polymerase sigma factor (sigma-70 family)
MDQHERERRLSSITTLWSVVIRAHQDAPHPVDEASAARRQLLERYIGAVYRYLLGALRDPDAADEVFQEFALRFVRGDFKRADPERGRFRDFVKTSLIHLVINYQQRKCSQPGPLVQESQLAAPEGPAPGDSDQEFTDRWKAELLTRAWQALAAFEQESGKPYHAVLHFRAEHPDLSSTQMAERLGAVLGRPFTSDSLRQALHRARQKFAELLIDEVAQSLETNDHDRVEQELLDLGLFPYCRAAWKQRDPPS